MEKNGYAYSFWNMMALDCQKSSRVSAMLYPGCRGTIFFLKLLDREEEESSRKRLLRERICKLYKAVLLYQIRVVCSQQHGISRESPDRVSQGQVLTGADLSVNDILNAEKALEDCLGESIESQIRRFISVRGAQRDVIAGGGGQKSAQRLAVDNETKVKVVLDDLSAVNRQQHHRDLYSNDSDEERSRHLTMPTYYPTVYWIRHLCHIIDDEEATAQAVDFMTKDLVKWSDLLASLGGLSQACCMMLDLETRLKRDLEAKVKSDKDGINVTYLWSFISHVHEAQKFLDFHKSMKNPARFGARNALLFCPLSSRTRQKLLCKETPRLEVSPILNHDWNLAVRVLQGHTGHVRCCAYSSHGQYVAFGSDRRFRVIAASDQYRIAIWNINDGKRHKLTANQYFDPEYTVVVSCFTFSNDGRKLAAAVGKDVKIWDVSAYSLLAVRDASQEGSWLTGLNFSNGDALLASTSGNSDGTLCIWDYSHDLVETTAETPVEVGGETDAQASAHTWAISCIAFSSNNKLIASTSEPSDGVICLWDGQSGSFRGQLRAHGNEVLSLDLSRNSRYLLSSSGDHTVKIWDTDSENGSQPLSLQHADWVGCAVFSRDGKSVVSGCDDKTCACGIFSV
ncbi:hypothetical protein FP744_10005087 [Trichoderma asperellum]